MSVSGAELAPWLVRLLSIGVVARDFCSASSSVSAAAGVCCGMPDCVRVVVFSFAVLCLLRCVCSLLCLGFLLVLSVVPLYVCICGACLSPFCLMACAVFSFCRVSAVDWSSQFTCLLRLVWVWLRFSFCPALSLLCVFCFCPCDDCFVVPWLTCFFSVPSCVCRRSFRCGG